MKFSGVCNSGTSNYYISCPSTTTIVSPYIGSGEFSTTQVSWLWECTNHQAQDLPGRVKGVGVHHLHLGEWHVQLWEKEGVWEHLLCLGDFYVSFREEGSVGS